MPDASQNQIVKEPAPSPFDNDAQNRQWRCARSSRGAPSMRRTYARTPEKSRKMFHVKQSVHGAPDRRLSRLAAARPISKAYAPNGAVRVVNARSNGAVRSRDGVAVCAREPSPVRGRGRFRPADPGEGEYTLNTNFCCEIAMILSPPYPPQRLIRPRKRERGEGSGLFHAWSNRASAGVRKK